MHWELIGGEVTTIPDFEEILQRLYDYKANVTVYSNGSRTVRWWEEARNYLQKLYKKDMEELESLGMGKLFGPGTPVEETLNYITNWVKENRR